MAKRLGSKVLLDSNALIYALEQRSDIRELLSQIPEVTGILVPTCVLLELERMSGDVNYARGALDLAKGFPSIEGNGTADDCLLELASRNGFFILTNDRLLISRARLQGTGTLTFKQRRRIEFT